MQMMRKAKQLPSAKHVCTESPIYPYDNLKKEMGNGKTNYLYLVPSSFIDPEKKEEITSIQKITGHVCQKFSPQSD